MTITELKQLKDSYEHAVRNNAPEHAKPIFAEMLKQAAFLGFDSFQRDAGRVPALDAGLRALLTGNKCGELLTAWLSAWDTANLAAPVFMLGQSAVYTEGDGTTRSVSIVRVTENAVRIGWLVAPRHLVTIALSHRSARQCLVLFPPGEKFMVLEGGAK